MAKKKTYGFDENGYRRVREAVQKVLGAPKTGAQQRRQPPVLGGGSGGGSLEVLFQVCEACCAECWADVIVLSQSTQDTIPGLGATVTECACDSESDGYCDKVLASNQIRVYDVAGCFLNEPDELLVGRRGYASYFYEFTPLEDCAGDPMDLTCGLTDFPTPRWEIKSLCCYQNECDEGYGYT